MNLTSWTCDKLNPKPAPVRNQKTQTQVVFHINLFIADQIKANVAILKFRFRQIPCFVPPIVAKT